MDIFRKGKSNFATTLVTGIGTGTSETITLNSTAGLPTDTEIVLTFNRVTSSGVVNPTSLVERIRGKISGSTLTAYTRGVDDTTEQAHSAGTVVEYIWSGADLNDLISGLLVKHNQDGTHKPLLTSITSYTPDAGGTAAIDLTKGNIHSITMPEGNITISASNGATGQCFIIEITQDGTGSRTVTWFATIRWADGTAPTLTTTASKRDVFGFRVTGANTYDGYVVGQNI
mgnify:CR=1 FL=1